MNRHRVLSALFAAFLLIASLGAMTPVLGAEDKTGGTARPGIRSRPDTPGAELWVARYNESGNRAFGAELATSPDGSTVFVTGSSGEISGDFATLAYDATAGDLLWAQSYNYLDGDDRPTALDVSPDGSTVFVTGVSGTAYATVAYDAATGENIWTRRYNGMGDGWDSPKALGVSPDGSTVFVTGYISNITGDEDYATLAYDAANGDTLWERRYNGPANDRDNATALRVSPDGSAVFVTGWSKDSTGQAKYATLAYDATTGTPQWVRRGHPEGVPAAMGVSPDGSMVFVTGKGSPTGGWDYATVAYATGTGATLWGQRSNGPADSDDEPTALVVSPDGSTVFVTGNSYNRFGNTNYATVAYESSTGDLLWARDYGGLGFGYQQAAALGVSPDGASVFVTGYSGGGDYATLAYEAASGATLWESRYDPGYATALDVSPDDSRVFVTGTSGNDIGTVAYSNT